MSYETAASRPGGFTRHAAERAAERGIDPADIALVATHGRGKVIIRRDGSPAKMCRLAPHDLRHLPELAHLYDVVVILGDNGAVITAFRDNMKDAPPKARLKRSKVEARKFSNRNAGQPWRGA